MTPDDIKTLKSRIETALAESVKDFGGAVPKKPRPSFAFASSRFWALANEDDTRRLVADPAVKAMGGAEFVVTVDENGAKIEKKAVAPVVKAETPAPPVTPPTAS